MKQTESISGHDLREMFATATSWLEKSAPEVDALNVFPVPDGDTGTNMLLTMRSTVEEAHRSPDGSVSAMVKAMSKGALMGARGNSGVILSQIWRGMAQSLDDKEVLTGKDLAEALVKASETAYKGLSNPVEGTILTVIKDAAAAAKAQAESSQNDLISVLEAAVNAASESVANTPNLLPVLREAGVVDAGGQGLYTILEGALRHLRGEREQMQFRKPQMITSNIPVATGVPHISTEDEIPFGYCTEFLLKGEQINPDKLRTKLEKKGVSLIVVGDEVTARVHIHTLDPGHVLSYAASLGTLHQVSIRNMDEQHHDFLEMQKERLVAVDTAIIAVASGEGLSDVFKSLGATAIVHGGQTMNPSTKELLNAVEAVASDKVILLPNNKNIVTTAQQVKSLTKKTVAVVPSEAIPQGVAALLSFDYEADFESNVENMTKAKSSVKSIEITRSVRATTLNGLHIKKKQAIGLLDDRLIAADDDTAKALDKVLDKVDLNTAEVVTIYYGSDTKEADAETVGNGIREKHPHLQVEVVKGGQPHYDYIVSVE
ncbi:MAG: DAK2 domain-containing protein [Chloroflexi bacterium]|nr:DAK2 domain-containing protein [Chloroflexota bacterium]